MMPRARRKPSLAPGYDGKREMAPAIVDSPYVKGEYDAVVRNNGESPLASLHSHHEIDDAQLMAGTWFRKTYECTRMGSMAVDPSREPVDTSGIADPIPDRVISASQELARARAEIGRKPYRTVELVCGEGYTIKEASIIKTEREYAYTGRQLKDALDTLAEWRGYAMKKT